MSGLHISYFFKILRPLRVRDGEAGEGAVPSTKHEPPSITGGVETSQVSQHNVFTQLGGVSQSEEENALQARVVVNNVLVSLEQVDQLLVSDIKKKRIKLKTIARPSLI